MVYNTDHEYHDRVTVFTPDLSSERIAQPPQSFPDDLEKAIQPAHLTTARSRILGDHEDEHPKFPVRPCPSAGTLAPELAILTPIHDLRYDDQGGHAETPIRWQNCLFDYAKSELCITLDPQQASSKENFGIDVGAMQAFAVSLLQREVAEAGRQIIHGKMPEASELQALLHRYCKLRIICQLQRHGFQCH